MRYFYDITKQAFLVEGIHQIPDSAIEVNEQEYQALIDGRAKGKAIIVMNGTLTLTSVKPSAYHSWNGSQWVLSEENQRVEKAGRQARMRAMINAKRDACVNGGVYVPAIDKWVDTDDNGRATLVEIKADFDLNGKDSTYTLICADNTAKTITFDEFKAVWDAVKNLKEAMFENAYMHKVLMMATDNPLEYDYSVGWVTPYREAHND